MDKSGWSTMLTVEVTILYWLKDLDTSKNNQAGFGDKVHKAWDGAESKGKVFSIHDVV